MVRFSHELAEVLVAWDEEKYSELRKIKDSPIDFVGIAITNPSKISYITEGRSERFDSDFWNESLREKFAFMGKIGKVLNKISTEIKLTTNDVEKIQALLSARQENVLALLEIVEGDTIKKLYHQDYYSTCENGTLNASCMRYEECQNWFDVYTQNCKMLVLWENNNKQAIAGRAIVWDVVDDEGESEVFLDRIYGTTQTIELFKIYAKKEGWLYKGKQSYDCNTVVENDIVVVKNLTCYIDGVCDNYPFIDSMYYLSDDGTLRNYSQGFGSGDRNLQNTDGNSSSVCERCGEHCDEEDLTWIESEQRHVCQGCLDYHYEIVNDEYYDTDSEDIFYCNNCNEYCLVTDSNNTVGDGLVCDSCIEEDYCYVESEGAYEQYHKCRCCEECEEYHSKATTTFYELNNTIICENCISDYVAGQKC